MTEPSATRPAWPRSPRRRRLLLGDWHPLLRDPIDLLRATFAAGAVVLLALGEYGAALRMAGTFVLVGLARTLDLPRIVDLGFVLGMGLQAFGNVLDTFKAVGWYDDVVHVVLSFFTAPVFYVVLIRIGAVRDLPDTPRGWGGATGIIVITGALGTTFGAFYEIYEYVVVRAFGAGLAIGYQDTVMDLLADGVASLLGGVLLVVWARAGWGTSRRLATPDG